MVDSTYNPQNDRWIRFQDAGDAGDAEEAPVGKYLARSKHPASAMFLGAVASTGEASPPIWFPTGFRLDSDGYIESLKKTLIPWMRRVAAAHGPAGRPAHIIFQQDSAPAHRAKKTLDFLRSEKLDFWTPNDWPPNSPNLNPLDYGIWSMVTEGACKDRPASVKALKMKVGAYWRRMDPDKIRQICRSFKPRLAKCIESEGSFFLLKIEFKKK